MTNAISVPRKLIVLAIVLPLAAILGYMLSDPFDAPSLIYVLGIAGVLVAPILLKWHHPLLLLCWNSGILIYMLPGQPQVWMPMSFLSLGITILSSTLNKEQKVNHVPAITWSLIALCVVVFLTAKVTGGLGVRALGGSIYGGKKYYAIFFAVVGYFAISMNRVAPEKIHLYATLFLLGGLALASSNIIYYFGQNFWFLYNFFPSELAMSQAMEDMAVQPTTISRLSGLGFSGMAAFSYMLMRYGIKGLMDLGKPWRLALFVVIIGVSLLGGFRSVLVLYFLILFVQYSLEGLWRSKSTVYLAIGALIFFTVGVFYASKLPMSIQRSLSFIPGLQVQERARSDAQASLDWRLRMWTLLYPEIPKYFWLGKGYTTTATDMHLAMESVRRGLGEDIQMSLIAGDYHSGPLSLLVPFGIWGLLAFAAFVVASIRMMRANLRYGDPRLYQLNLFLLALFIARVIFYIVVFGAINSDMAILAGIVGLSVCLNRGQCKPAALPERSPASRPLGRQAFLRP